jgi:hypothetical protein
MPDFGRDPTTSDDFSLELYEQTLLKAKQLGYSFPTVSELGAGVRERSRFLLLRHDIDTSPRHALQMAELEHRLGVRSSYFVLMHSLYYNPGAPLHWDALRRIVDLGFEVGLHYETDFHEHRGRDPLQGVLADAAALEKILDIKIVSVSQHRPASSMVLEELSRHYQDAYRYDLVHDLCYISDSGFKWRGKSLIELLGVEERIHALIHPLTWSFGDAGMEDTYRRMSAELSAELAESFESFIDSTRRYLLERPERDRARRARYRERTPEADPKSEG